LRTGIGGQQEEQKNKRPDGKEQIHPIHPRTITPAPRKVRGRRWELVQRSIQRSSRLRTQEERRGKSERREEFHQQSKRPYH
jgi:hypothetical protein